MSKDLMNHFKELSFHPESIGRNEEVFTLEERQDQNSF